MAQACTVVCAVGALACKGRSGDATGGGALPAGSATAVDHLLPGEVVEGPERAFDFPVPRGMRVRGRFPDVVHIEGRVPFEPLTNYVRERVDAERVETGPVKTVFDNAKLRAKPEQVVRIEVTYYPHKVELTIRNQSRPTAEPGVSEAERWRQSGLTPDGQPLPEQNE
jgi:hypothetical protein